jgi:surface carbohydrate biosynthesis protein
MTKSIDFLISYEHKSRELESVLLIKIELEKRGYSVLIHGLYDNDFDRYRSLKKNNPRVVIVPAAYDYGILSCFAYNLVGLKKKVVNLQWEQILSLKEEADRNGYHNPKGLAKQAVHLCWGEKSRTRLINSGVSPKNAIITGPVHLDLLRPEFNEYFISKEKLSIQFNLDISKEWILFISSFSYCSLSDVQLNTIAQSYGIDDTNYFKHFSIESKNEILNWFERILEDEPNRILIYRPHPEEMGKDARLLALERKYSNFRVVSEHALKHWVKASDSIYNWYSTSMADIYFSKKPCQILRPIQIINEQEVSIFEEANFITTFDEFRDCLKNNYFKNPLSNEIMKCYYDLHLDNTPAYSRVCDILEQVYHSNLYKINFSMRLKFREFINDFKVPIGNYFFSHIPIDSRLRRISFISKRIESREKISEWYKKSFHKSVATNSEIINIESALKELINN